MTRTAERHTAARFGLLLKGGVAYQSGENSARATDAPSGVAGLYRGSKRERWTSLLELDRGAAAPIPAA